jgi:hypothetical protein
MFKFFSNVADSIAPMLRSNVETLQHNWKRANEAYGNLVSPDANIDDPTALQSSRIAEYLNNMVQAVLSEEQDMVDDEDSTGPCFEFLLQQAVIDHLCAIGMPNVCYILAPFPPGSLALLPWLPVPPPCTSVTCYSSLLSYINCCSPNATLSLSHFASFPSLPFPSLPFPSVHLECEH